MTISVSPSETDAMTTLRAFLASVMPAGLPIIRGQVNRAAMPSDPDFIVMTPIRRERLETNVDQFVDTRVFASIRGQVMTVTQLSYGMLKVGSVIFGVGVQPATTVTAQLTGSAGGSGTYSVSPSQIAGDASSIMAAGVLNAMNPTELTIQLDVHGPNSADYAHRVNTMLRDDYAFQAMKQQGLGVLPLTAYDPMQMPFIDAEEQYEDRWIVQACLQVNATVNDIPQQFFEKIVAGLINVDAKYPA